ncbi:FAD:protein FMN transferase [bacterium]|nr:FAD:protein FMN transferase [bacterium]
MASPCEILVDHPDSRVAGKLLEIASRETWRIEAKYSRYRTDNIVHRINEGGGSPVEVDDETARLLDFATHCYTISDGRFDITSGVLRRAWKFDGSDRVPTPEQVEACLPFVGWEKVAWHPPRLALPEGMEIDLGGIGKEYAVDRVLSLLQAETDASLLVNFGGDLHASGPRRGGFPWRVGVECLAGTTRAEREIELTRGALATSGDAQRFLARDGVRYSHVLDPRSGWPVTGAPRSVTVLADSCTEAGLLATISLLRGSGAEDFLEKETRRHWCLH